MNEVLSKQLQIKPSITTQTGALNTTLFTPCFAPINAPTTKLFVQLFPPSIKILKNGNPIHFLHASSHWYKGNRRRRRTSHTKSIHRLPLYISHPLTRRIQLLLFDFVANTQQIAPVVLHFENSLHNRLVLLLLKVLLHLGVFFLQILNSRLAWRLFTVQFYQMIDRFNASSPANVWHKTRAKSSEVPMQRRSYYDDQIDSINPYMRRFAAANHILRYANRIIKKQNLFHHTARRFVQEAAWNEECTGFPGSFHCSSATPSTFNLFLFHLTLLHSVGACANCSVLAKMFSVLISPNPAWSSKSVTP